jgi:hypothetical protein
LPLQKWGEDGERGGGGVVSWKGATSCCGDSSLQTAAVEQIGRPEGDPPQTDWRVATERTWYPQTAAAAERRDEACLLSLRELSQETGCLWGVSQEKSEHGEGQICVAFESLSQGEIDSLLNVDTGCRLQVEG